VRKSEKKNHLEDPGINGRIILRWIFRKWNVGAWIHLALDRDRWRALANKIMNLLVP
jgi:hypothetical protein